MPTKNPKHRKNVIAQKREETYKKKARSFHISKKYTITFFVLLIMTLSIVVAVFSGDSDDEDKIVVEEGDVIIISYKVWAADIEGPNGRFDRKGEPDLLNSSFEVEFVEDNFLDAVYINIEGMELGKEKYFDIAYDEGYTGNHDWANKKLLYWVYIEDIQKVNATESEV